MDQHCDGGISGGSRRACMVHLKGGGGLEIQERGSGVVAKKVGE